MESKEFLQELVTIKEDVAILKEDSKTIDALVKTTNELALSVKELSVQQRNMLTSMNALTTIPALVSEMRNIISMLSEKIAEFMKIPPQLIEMDMIQKDHQKRLDKSDEKHENNSKMVKGTLLTAIGTLTVGLIMELMR